MDRTQKDQRGSSFLHFPAAMAAALLLGACASNLEKQDIPHAVAAPAIHTAQAASERAHKGTEHGGNSLENLALSMPTQCIAETTPITEPVKIVGRIGYDQLDDGSSSVGSTTANSALANQPVQQQAAKPKTEVSIWTEIRKGLRFKRPSRKAIDAEIKWIAERKEYLRRALVAAQPYLHYVVNEVKRRGLPTELALLPIIESGFDPKATSPTGASGLWQFMPSTAKALGLRQSAWYDARSDLIASTHTALTYLANLNNRFGGNWALTLAAYNAGAAKVWRAMKQNRRKGEPQDYWSLPLPAETNRYVPRLLAIAEIVSQPSKYKFRLPRIPNEPQFEIVDFEGHIDLTRLAEVADVEYDVLEKLNPGYKYKTTDPSGPNYLLLPKSSVADLRNALDSGEANANNVVMARYEVKYGDSLGVIAQRHGVSVDTLKQINQLRSNRINAGAKLLIPVTGSNDAHNDHVSATPVQEGNTERIVHTVKSNESLSLIARRYGVSYVELAQWNELGDDAPLHPGQRIEIKHSLTNPADRGHSI